MIILYLLFAFIAVVLVHLAINQLPGLILNNQEIKFNFDEPKQHNPFDTKTSYNLIVNIVAISVAVAIAYLFGVTLESFFNLILLYSLLALFFIDLKHQLLPDIITLPLLWIGLLYQIYFGDLEAGVIGAIFGYMSLWSVYWLHKLLSNKEGLGYGDFKLTAAIGAWMGWQALPQILLFAAIFASVFFAIKKIDKGKPFAFGPFLIISAVFVTSINYTF